MLGRKNPCRRIFASAEIRQDDYDDVFRLCELFVLGTLMYRFVLHHWRVITTNSMETEIFLLGALGQLKKAPGTLVFVWEFLRYQ